MLLGTSVQVPEIHVPLIHTRIQAIRNSALTSPLITQLGGVPRLAGLDSTDAEPGPRGLHGLPLPVPLPQVPPPGPTEEARPQGCCVSSILTASKKLSRRKSPKLGFQAKENGKLIKLLPFPVTRKTAWCLQFFPLPGEGMMPHGRGAKDPSLQGLGRLDELCPESI